MTPKRNPSQGGEKSREKSWQHRLTAQADAATAEFVAGIDVDRELWRYDIAGSKAHARMLGKVGLLTAREAETILKGLDAVAGLIEAGRLAMPVEL